MAPGVPRGSRAARRLAASPVDRTALPPLDPDREALTVFTSGTTAQPKAVVHTAGSLLAGCDLLRDVFALAPGDVVHTDQMLLGVPALLAGATWSVPADPPGRDITTFARQLDGAAGTYLVPADATALLDAVEAGRVPARGPRVALVGGAPVTRALLERATRVLPGTRWAAVYGMTEILPVAVVEARRSSRTRATATSSARRCRARSCGSTRSRARSPRAAGTAWASPGATTSSGSSCCRGRRSWRATCTTSTPPSAARAHGPRSTAPATSRASITRGGSCSSAARGT